MVGSIKLLYFYKSDVSVSAVQRHPKSLIFVRIERMYATSYYSVIVTLVLSCTISEILQLLLLIPTLFRPNFGVFPLDQIAHVGVNVSKCLKLFGGEIIFEVFEPV